MFKKLKKVLKVDIMYFLGLTVYQKATILLFLEQRTSIKGKIKEDKIIFYQDELKNIMVSVIYNNEDFWFTQDVIAELSVD